MITAALVKDLRTKTGAGMMDCKKALTECEGDIQKAVDWLRERGIAQAAKKAGRIAAEGLTKVVVNGNFACVIELNSETDFVAKNEQFLSVLDTVANAVLNANPKDMDEANAVVVDGKTIADLIVDATATIGEKISFRRFEVIEKTDADTFGSYMHMGGKISAVSVIKDCANAEVAKDIAMQVASMSPQFISRDQMDQAFVDHEREIQMELIKNDESLANKPEKVIAGIVEGRLSKTLQDLSLVDQLFFKNQDIKVSQFLKESNTEVTTFVRYAVGEGIEKREDNFADEVANAFK